MKNADKLSKHTTHSMESDELIVVRDLHKSFGELHILKGISTTIKKGEKVVIIGPSGSGKSTFLRCLNLLERPTSGSIALDEIDLLKLNEKGVNYMRQSMGMVFQHFNLFPHLTIRKNITLAPVRTGLMTKEEARKAALELLGRVGLQDKAEAYPAQLRLTDGERAERIRANRGFVRTALHAWRVTFLQPFSREPVAVTAPLPADFRRVIAEEGDDFRLVREEGTGRSGLTAFRPHS